MSIRMRLISLLTAFALTLTLSVSFASISSDGVGVGVYTSASPSPIEYRVARDEDSFSYWLCKIFTFGYARCGRDTATRL